MRLPVATILRRGLVTAAAAVAGAWLAGRLLSDRWTWSQWLLWIPAPAAAGAALAGMGAAALGAGDPRRRRAHLAAWALLAAAIAAWWGAVENRFLRRCPAGAGAAGAIRLVQGSVVNTGPGFLDRWGRVLNDLGADVTIVSTLLPPRTVHRLADRLDGLGNRAVAWPFVLATRLPILEARPLVSNGDVYAAVFRLDGGEALPGPLTIYAIDLPSDPRRGRRELALAVRRILDGVAAPPPDVVAGDFNMTRGSASIGTLFPGFRDAWSEAGRGWGASFPRRLPLYQLDHVLLAPPLRAACCELIDPGLGRHRLQVVTLERAAPQP